MYPKIICIFMTIVCLTLYSANASAQVLEEPVPYIKSTEQWSVQLSKSVSENLSNEKPKSDAYNEYSLLIRNTGEARNNVTVEAYRNEPNSHTKYGLWSSSIGHVQSGGIAFEHTNLPVGIMADTLLIDVMWEDSATKNGRKFKQTFAFAVNR